MDETRRLEPGTSSASSSGLNFAPHQQHDQLPDQLQVPLKKKRFCQFCRNHKIQEPTKGHKNECRFRFCKCPKCKNTRERHKVMAKQVAIKREKELAAYRKNQRSYETASSTPPQSASSAPSSPQNPPGAPESSLRIMWERILTVLVEKGYSLDTYPLLYIILKEVTSDVEEVYQKIAQCHETFAKLLEVVEANSVCRSLNLVLGTRILLKTNLGRKTTSGSPTTLPYSFYYPSRNRK